MNKKEKILDLYFNKHLLQEEIAKQLDVSQQYISKTIKKDERYLSEKTTRKAINSKRRKIAQAEYQKNYVRKRQKDTSYEQLLAQQKQDAIELSYNAYPLSDYTCRKANASIYRYDKNKSQYIMLRGIKASADLPKRVKANIY